MGASRRWHWQYTVAPTFAASWRIGICKENRGHDESRHAYGDDILHVHRGFRAQISGKPLTIKEWRERGEDLEAVQKNGPATGTVRSFPLA